MAYKKVKFTNPQGIQLVGKLEFPLTQKPEAFAIFAHVFTGNKNLLAAKHISRALTLNGIAVLRFDFTGLGESGGEFANTNFSTNISDIIAASDYLAEHYTSPKIVVGQSLGGAASVFAADLIDSVQAVATIGTPSEPEHVTHLLQSKLDEIEKEGEAEVMIGERTFTFKKQFIEDLESKDMFAKVSQMDKALLILHSPQDSIVTIDHAAKIYHAAKHPKSFVTLNNANHMLTNKNDAFYTGTVIASWVKRYIEIEEDERLSTDKQVVVRIGDQNYTTEILAGKHGILADESEAYGGNDFGPSPYELLNAALGACTAMTIKMYAAQQGWEVEEVKVHLSYANSYKTDCTNCTEENSKIEEFELVIDLVGNLTLEQKQTLKEIASKCPVYRTLTGNAIFKTSLS